MVKPDAELKKFLRVHDVGADGNCMLYALLAWYDMLEHRAGVVSRSGPDSNPTPLDIAMCRYIRIKLGLGSSPMFPIQSADDHGTYLTETGVARLSSAIKRPVVLIAKVRSICGVYPTGKFSSYHQMYSPGNKLEVVSSTVVRGYIERSTCVAMAEAEGVTNHYWAVKRPSQRKKDDVPDWLLQGYKTLQILTASSSRSASSWLNDVTPINVDQTQDMCSVTGVSGAQHNQNAMPTLEDTVVEAWVSSTLEALASRDRGDYAWDGREEQETLRAINAGMPLMFPQLTSALFESPYVVREQTRVSSCLPLPAGDQLPSATVFVH
jgi:hypothetical protein